MKWIVTALSNSMGPGMFGGMFSFVDLDAFDLFGNATPTS